MGQRSQIYISWENDNGERELVARYFSWNYGERMISRAAALIDHLSMMADTNDFKKEKITKISEINFDMRDVAMTSDLIEEALNDGYNETKSVLFNNDNNDGKLFITVCKTDGEHTNAFGRITPNRKILYCFTDCDNQNIMDARQYLQWDCGDDMSDNESWKSGLDHDTIKYTEENIKTIDETGELMTEENLQDFINYDYPCLQNIV